MLLQSQLSLVILIFLFFELHNETSNFEFSLQATFTLEFFQNRFVYFRGIVDYFHLQIMFRCFLFAAPDPPSNLSVAVRTGKNAVISWSPPAQGNYSAFKLKVRFVINLDFNIKISKFHLNVFFLLKFNYVIIYFVYSNFI